ncbi:MAG: DEAD/DEAH box helicase [Nibricoccus sp.]
MLRLLLPPNLAAAAPRDAIALKVELNLDAPPSQEILPALALLQSWCGTPKPPAFLQLKRAQLRQLVSLLTGQPVFFWVNAPQVPVLWVGPLLRGVSEFLNEPDAPKTIVPSYVPPGVTPSPTTRAKPLASRDISTSFTVDGSEHFLAVTLPSRESVSYSAALELVKSNGFVLEPSNRKWWLRDRHKTLNFLATHGDRLRNEFHAEFTPNFEKNTARLTTAEVVCDAVDNGNGFNVTVALRAGKVPEDQLLSAAASNRGYVEAEGRVFLVSPKQLAGLANAQRALAGDTGAGVTTNRTHRVSTARLAEAEAIIEEIAPHFQPPSAWRERSEALRNLSKLAPAPIPAGFDTQLRPYQKLGAAWLWHLYRHNLGGILADEMGLGKTLQALAVLAALREEIPNSKSQTPKSQLPITHNPSPITSSRPSPHHPSLITHHPSLVICPATLVENWRREAARFTPQLRVFIHHGDRRLMKAADFAGIDLIVTSYGTLARDRALFGETEFAVLIADEAQHLKNRRTQNAQTLRSLRARGRFLLTGTPLENSLDDLRSLFEVLMPGYLEKVPPGTRGEDRLWYDERLRAKTATYILRRTKQAVAPELPPKIEQVLYCELSPTQSALYRQVQEESERALMDLEASGASENAIRFATLTQLLRLRQVCCDPRLLPGRDGPPGRPLPPPALDASPARPAVAPYPQSDTSPSPITHNPSPSSESAKLDAFRELLAEAIDDGHRLLVFSQFTSLLALLRTELEAQQIPFCYLDGSMSTRARQAAVDQFNTANDIPVFLISLKAGGTGLNLTSADTVIHFDPWWNPAVEAQATDRAHRIGQSRVVTSYKLICSGTVEEKVLQLQESKRALLADVFEASDAASAKLSLADLRSLLTS